MTDAPSLTLRYVACDACETVFAVPDAAERPAVDRAETESDACDRCGARALRELRDVRGPDAYFSP
jgi:rRNA maturation endonuclease Nob1